MKSYVSLAKAAGFGGAVTALLIGLLMYRGLSFGWALHIGVISGFLVSYFSYRFGDVLRAIPAALEEGAHGFSEAWKKLWLRPDNTASLFLVVANFLFWLKLFMLMRGLPVEGGDPSPATTCVLLFLTTTTMLFLSMMWLVKKGIGKAMERDHKIFNRWRSYQLAPYHNFLAHYGLAECPGNLADFYGGVSNAANWADWFSFHGDVLKGFFWMIPDGFCAAFESAKRAPAKTRAVVKIFFRLIHSTERVMTAVYGPIGGAIGFLLASHGFHLTGYLLIDAVILGAILGAGGACAAYRLFAARSLTVSEQI